ncbi:MAG: hypothetical protein ACK5E4_02480, partial [Planctomycetia bacterium]
HEGKFAISKAGFFQGLSRGDEDSITRLKSAIIRVFEEAKKRGNINYQPALNGIRVLEGAYKENKKAKANKPNKKGEVQEIIMAVENLDKDFAVHAYSAIQIARNQIKWSANKRYQVTTNMSSKAASLGLGNMDKINPKSRANFISNRFGEAYKLSLENFYSTNKSKLDFIKFKLDCNSQLSTEENNLWLELQYRQNKDFIRHFAFQELAGLGVGNCGEMSKLAFNHLKSKNVAVSRISLGEGEKYNEIDRNNNPVQFKGDHVFLLVGQCFHEFDENGNIIPNNVDPWIDHKFKFNKGVYVCDPWANIVCPVGLYASQWEAKMQKWSSAKKFITYDKVETDPYKNPNYRRCISLCRWQLCMQHIPS